MNRRLAMLASAAVAAGAAGVGAAWWRSRTVARPVEADIWPMHFDAPQGGQVSLARFRGKPLLLNFWATWCPPCVGELPLLDQFEREQRGRGWQVVGLAVDNREPVVEFLAQRPVRFAVGLAGMAGVELSRSMGNTGGALPFSVVFDRSGLVMDRRLGVIHPEDLQRWVAAAG